MLRHYRNKHGITSLERREAVPQTEGYTPQPPPLLSEGYTPPPPLTEGLDSLCRLGCVFFNSIYCNAHIMLYLGPFYYFYCKSYRAMPLYF